MNSGSTARWWTGFAGLREEGTTLFTVLLAGFQVWLHRYTGQTDVMIGTPVANRERPEVQSLIGYFLNTLPIRVQMDGEPAPVSGRRWARATNALGGVCPCRAAFRADGRNGGERARAAITAALPGPVRHARGEDVPADP